MVRKKKTFHKTVTTDDKRLQNTLKRLNVNTIPGIEEVNIFTGDTVIHFSNPKVQASIGANTYVITGTSSQKKITELLPNIISQMGHENIANLKRIAEQYQSEYAQTAPDLKDDDEEVPDLVPDFEKASEEV